MELRSSRALCHVVFFVVMVSCASNMLLSRRAPQCHLCATAMMRAKIASPQLGLL